MIHRLQGIVIAGLSVCAYSETFSREMESLHPDPGEVHRRRFVEYNLEDCFQIRREIPRLILSEQSSSEWIVINAGDFNFRFGPRGLLEIDSGYNWTVVPPMSGAWTIAEEAYLLEVRYRQFLIRPCMATCMVGTGYIFPEKVDPDAFEKWGFRDAQGLGDSNSCKMHCFKRIIDDYGKTFVDFSLQLRIRTDGPSQPSILIEPVQHQDPEPVDGKKRYVIDSFSRPMQLRCNLPP